MNTNTARHGDQATPDPLLSRLAPLDAAPRTEPTATEIDREETLLRTILADTEPARTSVRPATRAPLVRRVSFTLAGALAAGLAVLTATGGLSGLPGMGSQGPLSSAELASWTGTPSSLDSAGAEGSAAEKECLDATEDYGSGPAVVSNADIRGNVASMVVSRGGDAVYCLAGADGGGTTMGISPVLDLPADGIELDTYGSRGEDDGLLNYAVGSVGSDVEKVTVRDSGHTVRATVENGRWTAWWPRGDRYGLLTGTVTLTLTDGTTRTIKSPELP
ncbi:hypothetical protein F9278_25230 [Streptomyces phaeolivaceus]|uniref:Uncharacterized protein n=1 Tax=Streptomyces phaeolivaceus TaxID=2653200 RepID=A0A5P8K788_9ACTN|nr:hypothetical protein [Streptomyces phaeolivaceus]QFQ98910.1 hypothetical protein F9278_25230 [Streptomyces phaeolivaceus]